MKLSVLERLLIQSLIPKEATYAHLKLIRVAREALSFTDEEVKLLNIREVGSGPEKRIEWDKTVEEKDITIGETVTGMIVAELKKMDSAGKLTADFVSIYEKFLQE